MDSLGSGTYSGNSVDAIIVLGDTVSHDATWAKHDVPYVMSNDVLVEAASGGSAILQLAPLQMTADSTPASRWVSTERSP